MLTISIIFALLVALWGFSGALLSHAKRAFTRVNARPRPVAPRSAPSRTRGTRPVPSA